MDFTALRNSFIVGSLGTSFTGLILLASPYSQFSQFLIASGLGSLAASNLAIENCGNIASRKLGKKQNELTSLQGEVSHFATLLTAKHEQLTAAIEARANLFNDYQLLENELEEMSNELTATQNQLKNTQQLNLESAIATLQDSLTEATQGVNNLIPYLVKKYKLDVKDLLKEYQSEVREIQLQVKVLAGKNNLTNEEIISACLAIQHQIILKGSAMRARMYKLAVDELQMKAHCSIPITLHNEKMLEVKTFYLGNIKSIQQEFGQVADSCISAYKQDFSEVVNDGLTQSQELEKLQGEVVSLKHKLSELSKPLKFPGLSEQARVGNAIIDFYSRLGYTLDGIDWTTAETGYKLLFHTSRNGSRFISTDLLNDGDSSAKLKEVSAALNNPKFEQGDRASYVSLIVQTRHKTKTSADDIAKLWLPSTQFPQLAKNWTRLRLTGGSESGKSPTAENIAVCILQSRPGLARLFNPQHNSSKNYWTIPVVGESHNDSENGIAKLAKLVDLRSTGQESRDTFELYIFDEIDSTMSHTHGKKSAIGDNVKFIIKQASHQNLGAIFIGQNANVTNYPGLDRSDWNSAVNIHIGSNSYDAITNSNKFTSDEQSKLKTTADKLTEYCEGKNEELGLGKTHPQAFRFALVIEPSKSPYFIELPSFGKYTYDLVVDSSITTDELSCSGCGSTAVKKNGKVNGQQRYKCNDCGKNWL
jgi:hypothetical protein